MRLLIYILLFISTLVSAEQKVDFTYEPKNQVPYFKTNKTPRVHIDEAHNNFHTLTGRYAPFAKVLASDGYVVKSNINKFTKESLKNIDILVIANPVADENKTNWDLPNYPAFSRQEIETLHRWVKNGGALLLIADHMPWPKASEDLAAIFGFHFTNGYVEMLGHREQYFENADGSLLAHSITQGINPTSKVTKVRGFMGQAFLAPVEAKPLLVFTKKSVSYMPSESFAIDEHTPTIPVTNWFQGATLKFGKGRMAVFGEAGMFTAQIASDDKDSWNMGLNAKGSEQNERFLLNVMLWLSGEL
ncbi:DUF4350 domain-containing protein [Shewanella sp. 202IG2-18]|uniref:DUF4350 domain-containing protein n=1 Tax=Parashewanella hymeniacidonis TaxID=2807618 RepID=UPI001960DFC8|nr:DUF4350 domain-containing protein [Parashewanella hymeniacidonis]MBM7074011.1 DUF4350 domain-containing protein [Parashewanella hymeniacidonis]